MLDSEHLLEAIKTKNANYVAQMRHRAAHQAMPMNAHYFLVQNERKVQNIFLTTPINGCCVVAGGIFEHHLW